MAEAGLLVAAIGVTAGSVFGAGMVFAAGTDETAAGLPAGFLAAGAGADAETVATIGVASVFFTVFAADLFDVAAGVAAACFLGVTVASFAAVAGLAAAALRGALLCALATARPAFFTAFFTAAARATCFFPVWRNGGLDARFDTAGAAGAFRLVGLRVVDAFIGTSDLWRAGRRIDWPDSGATLTGNEAPRPTSRFSPRPRRLAPFALA